MLYFEHGGLPSAFSETDTCIILRFTASFIHTIVLSLGTSGHSSLNWGACECLICVRANTSSGFPRIKKSRRVVMKEARQYWCLSPMRERFGGVCDRSEWIEGFLAAEKFLRETVLMDLKF